MCPAGGEGRLLGKWAKDKKGVGNVVVVVVVCGIGGGWQLVGTMNKTTAKMIGNVG